VGFAAGWAGVEQDNETDTGYDKTYKNGGRLVHENGTPAPTPATMALSSGIDSRLTSRAARQHR